MKNILNKITLSLALVTCLTLPASGQYNFNKTKADSLMNALVKNNDMIGGVAAFSIDGEILWQNVVGMKDKETEKKFDLSTLTRSASIAKPITAVAAMQLVEQGKLDLDVPIQTYIPEYPKSTMGDITSRHLLNHTSGITAYASSKEALTTKDYPTLKDASTVFENRDLLFEPGSAYYYTTYGYVVLGRVIEAASGQSYKEYVQDYIFNKAGMNNTSAEIYGQTYPNKSSLYHKKGKGKIVKVKKPNNLSNRIPGGGYHTTAEDMIKFGNAVMNGTLLSEASLKDMWTDGKVRLKEDGNPYAKGWFLYGENDIYGQIIGHSGGQTGCSSQLMLLPDINAVVIVLANTSGSWGQVIQASIQLYYCQ